MADQQVGNIHGFAAASKGSVVSGSAQQTTLTVDATGGTYDLAIDGTTVDATLAFDRSAANLLSDIEAVLPNVVRSVTGGPGDDGGTAPYVITFLTGGPHTVTAADDNLTGGAGTSTVETTQVASLDPVFESVPNLSGSDDPQDGFFDADMVDIDAMRTRLASIDGTYYTATRLNGMSWNDMVYAIRTSDHSETISQ